MSFDENPWRRPNRRKSADGNGDTDNSRDKDDSEWGLQDPFDFGFRSGFGNIDEMIERMFKAMRDRPTTDLTSPNSLYYGYSLNIGPDGKPRVREFGNVKPTSRGAVELGSREPFVDTVIDEKENKLKILAEMPGVQKEDIRLEVLEGSLKITAEHGDRKYETSVPITVAVDTSTASATCNNGVLEVTMRLKEKPKPKGVNIRVD